MPQPNSTPLTEKYIRTVAEAQVNLLGWAAGEASALPGARGNIAHYALNAAWNAMKVALAALDGATASYIVEKMTLVEQDTRAIEDHLAGYADNLNGRAPGGDHA